MRVSDGAFKTQNDASGEASFHRLDEHTATVARTVLKDVPKRKKASKSLVELEALLDASRLDPTRVLSLSQELGVSTDALERMEIGWLTRKHLFHLGTKCTADGAYTFPMRDTDGDICGYRLRANGFKYSLSGGNNGFFIPKGLKRGLDLVVVEGPSDLASVLSYGLSGIGRSNNTASTRALACLIGKYHPQSIRIVVDHDLEGSKAFCATHRGAESLKQMLKAYATRVPCHIFRPVGYKDVRQMYINGQEFGQLEMVE